MHLTRVTSGAARQAAAPGGDADPLALLFAGEGIAITVGDAIAGSAFPATLQAALGDGEGAIAATDVTDLLIGDGGGDANADGDQAATDLAAALAGALGIVADPQAAAPNAATEGDELAIDPHATLVGEGGVVVTAALTTDAVAVDTGTTTASTTPVETVATQEVATEALPVEPDHAAARTLADATANAERPTVPTATAADAGEARPSTDTASAALDDRRAAKIDADDAATARRDVPTDVADKLVFSDGGSEQQSLDLGASDDQRPGTLTPAAASLGLKQEKFHAEPLAAQAAPAPLAPAADGNGDAARALPPLPPSSTASDAAPARGPHGAQHAGIIEGRWGDRVVDALRLSGVRGGGEIRLQLEPEGLGHIDVRLHMQQDGVRAVIVAEHESTRALITSQQQVLQDAFNRSDLRLSGFSVDVGSNGGAAAFGRGDGPDERGGDAPASTSSAPVSARGADVAEPASAPLANGRLSVRV